VSTDLELSQEVLSTLRQIIRAMDVHSKRLSKDFGLTGPQLVLVREISAHNGITVGQLARRVSLSQATVTSIIDRLESNGLAVRLRSSIDKRKVTLQITDKAKAILEANPTFLQEQFIRRFSELSRWEQTQMLSSIQRIASMMDADMVAPASELDQNGLALHGVLSGSFSSDPSSEWKDSQNS